MWRNRKETHATGAMQRCLPSSHRWFLSTSATVAKDSQTAARIDFHQRYAVHSQQTSWAGGGANGRAAVDSERRWPFHRAGWKVRAPSEYWGAELNETFILTEMQRMLTFKCTFIFHKRVSLMQHFRLGEEQKSLGTRWTEAHIFCKRAKVSCINRYIWNVSTVLCIIGVGHKQLV